MFYVYQEKVVFKFDFQGKKYRKFFSDKEWVKKITKIEVEINNIKHTLNIPEECIIVNIGRIAMLTASIGGRFKEHKDIAECCWYVKDDIETKLIVPFDKKESEIVKRKYF